jgi:hypothetical protein
MDAKGAISAVCLEILKAEGSSLGVRGIPATLQANFQKEDFWDRVCDIGHGKVLEGNTRARCVNLVLKSKINCVCGSCFQECLGIGYMWVKMYDSTPTNFEKMELIGDKKVGGDFYYNPKS